MVKIKIIACILIVGFVLISCAQNEDMSYSTSKIISSSGNEIEEISMAMLYPSYDESTEKSGYVDDNGNWVIPPEYDEVGVSYVENPNQNIYPVAIDEKWGYVDRKNQWVIKPQFVYAFYFTEDGIALASDEEIIKRFTKDSDGNDIEIGLDEDITKYIPKEDFEDGFAAKYSTYYTYIKMGYIDEKGDWYIKPTFNIPTNVLEVVPAWQFNFNNSSALMYDVNTEKYGFINRQGTWIVEPQYELEVAIKKQEKMCE